MAVRKLGDVAVGTTVKININGQSTQLLVLHQGKPDTSLYDASCNGTWICLKNIYKMREWDGGSNAYKNSDVQADLNGPFFNSIESNIQAVIKTVKIPYVNGSAVASGANGLSCKIFLLSGYEVGLTKSDKSDLPVDGAKLDYFQSGTSSVANQKRIAKYSGSDEVWWTRSQREKDSVLVWYVRADGNCDRTFCYLEFGVRPAFILPQDLVVLSDGTLITNQPPTAPGSIEVSGVVRGENATITLTAATDPDGTVESYIFERQVDGGAWQQVAQADSLTQTDAVGEEWGTVAYRACAVDDRGAAGPYITGETFTVNSGFVIIGGPAANMGDKPAPFNFDFVCAVSGQTSVDAISVSVVRDGEVVYTGTPNSGVQVSVYVDTRFMAPGQHTIQVSASKEDYQPASSTYTFNIPAVTLLPYEGKAQLPQNSAGQPVWWYGLARFIFGEGGKDLNTLLQEAKAGDLKMVTGSYQGTGQYNSANPSKIVCGFRPKFVIVLSDGSAGLGESTGILWVGSETIGSKHVTVDDTSFAWYSADSANNQLNTSGTKYFYLIAG